MSKEITLPYKPYLPESLLILGCCLGFAALIVQARFSVLLLLCVLGFCVLAVVGLCYWRKRGRAYSVLCTSMLLICGVSCFIQQQQFKRISNTLETLTPSSCVYELLSDSTQTRFGWKARANCMYKDISHQDNNLCAQVWLSSKEPLRYGDVLQLVGRYKKNSNDQYGQQNTARGICGTVQVLQVTRTHAPESLKGLIISHREALLQRINPDANASRALLAGCICGYKTGLSSFSITESLASCGLAHMVAVSGSHLALVASILTLLVGKTSLKPIGRVGIVVVVTGIFVVLCSCSSSAIRAWLMSVTTQAAVLSGRRSYALSASSLCGISMLTVRPFLVMDVGFLLSLSSVIGLCLFNSYGTYVGKLLVPQIKVPHSKIIGKFLQGIHPIQKSLGSSAVTSCVALISTLPLVIHVFGQLSLVSPLSNGVVGPLFIFFIMLGVMSVPLFFIPVLDSLMLTVLDAVAQFILLLAGWFSQLPLASIALDESSWWISVVVVTVLVAIALAWPRLSVQLIRWCVGAAVCLILLWFVQVRYFAPARVVVLDVGQGDAIVVQDGPQALLIDTGPKGMVMKALSRKQILHLDGVLLTHLHDDHIGGMEALATRMRVHRVLVGSGVLQAVSSELEQNIQKMTDQPAQELSYGSVIQVGRFSLRMVWPQKPTDGTHNADSIILFCRYQDSQDAQEDLTLLLTGDAEKDELDQVIQSHDIKTLDVLKVGHHGSEICITSDQARVLAPDFSLISVGVHNKYGHPSQVCLDALNQADSKVLCTKDYGDLELRPDGGGGFAIMGTRKGGIDD